MTTATQAAPTYSSETRGRRNGGSRTEPVPSAAAPNRTETWAQALGWFSIGLGVAQLAAPRAMARLIGVPDDHSSRNTMLALGLREVTSGVGILSSPDSPAWLWSRVGGDVMDLALLGTAFKADGADRRRVAAATAAVLGVTVLDMMTSRRLGEERQSGAMAGRKAGDMEPVRKSLTINRSPDEVYAFWRNFENLPRFMEHLESVSVMDDRHSHWKARAPAGASVEWDAEITDDQPGRLIAWRSLQDADVANRGIVRFVPAPGGRGTEIHVELRYDPPAGKLGTLVARLFGEEPGQQVERDLRRFKQVLETGEVVRSDASIHDGPHPAQPSAVL
jgi:Predicted integral membrane protein